MNECKAIIATEIDRIITRGIRQRKALKMINRHIRNGTPDSLMTWLTNPEAGLPQIRRGMGNPDLYMDTLKKARTNINESGLMHWELVDQIEMIFAILSTDKNANNLTVLNPQYLKLFTKIKSKVEQREGVKRKSKRAKKKKRKSCQKVEEEEKNTEVKKQGKKRKRKDATNNRYDHQNTKNVVQTLLRKRQKNDEYKDRESSKMEGGNKPISYRHAFLSLSENIKVEPAW